MKKLLFFILLFTFCFANVYVDSNVNEILDEDGKVSIIVMFKKEDSKVMRTSSNSQEMEMKMKIQNTISKTSIENEKVRELNIINGFSTEITKEDLEELKNNPNVEGIYYDHPVYLLLDESVPLINADDVWPMQYNSKNITGQGQTVCLIDTGVDYTHPYLGGCTTQEFLDKDCEKVIGGYDFYNGDEDPFDDNGHGTHCAGIIASTHPTYKGVAPDANIVAVKVFPGSGDTTISKITQGIQWCITNKNKYNISIISMSLGDNTRYSSYCDDSNLAYKTAINEAVAHNISVVIATGNNGYTNGIVSPACIENAIRVTGITLNNIFSYNRGGNFDDIIAAPGIDIISTYPIFKTLGGLAMASGTSMATPHVAGVIALYNQYYYDKYGRYVSPSEIKQMLNDTGHVIYDSGSGKNYSRVDAYNLFVSYNTNNPYDYYNNSDLIYFEINLSREVSNVYVNMTLPNGTTNEIIHLTNFTLTNYNGTYTIPNLHGFYSFAYVINDSGLIDYSNNYNFTVLYDYICVNFTDCNSSLIEYEKVLLNNSLSFNFDEYFTFNQNTEFNCNNYAIFNSDYFEITGDNSSLNNCIFYGDEFRFNSTHNFTLFNLKFMNFSEIYFNHSIVNAGNNSILLNEKVIANSINTTANYKINMSCDGLEIDVLHLNNITNSTLDFYDSDYFSTCFNDTIEFNSSLNGSYTYNIFNISVTNTTGGRTNTIYNYTYLFNVTNNNIINDIFTFNQSNNLQLFNLNSPNSTLIEFNVTKNIFGNYTLNYSVCSNKLNRCLYSNFTIEVLDIPSFNLVELTPYAVSNNSNVTFNLNVSNAEDIWFNLTLPNGSHFSDSYYAGYNYTTNQTGRHNITFYANDTFNYIISHNDYFEVLELEESNLTFTDSVGNLTNVTLKLYYRNQKLFSNSFSNSSIEVYNLLYDLEINFSRFKLYFENTTLINNSFNSIYDEVKSGDYFYTLTINNSFNFQNNYTLEINYSNLNYTDDNYLFFYKCDDWDFNNNLCNGVFENKNYNINKTTKIITYKDNTFSSFSLLQGMYCGDGVCNNGETCSSCSGDCGKCYIPSGGGSSGGGSSGGGSGGGGGGGSGGGSAILPKDARYKNITLDYTEFNLIENENYKIYVEQNTNNFSYSFYSNYYGELCFNEECIQIKPFELHEINSSEELTFEFKKQKIEYAQKLNISVQNKFLDKNKIKFYLDEFNDSRTLENKCASFLGYHISPCVDKQSCLFACRSIPLCSGMSNSEIFLDFSKFVYINRMELNQLYLDCYALETENISEYKKCIMEIYGKAKEIESSPLFGTCPTCLGVCEETNYSYNSLDKILILLNDYEKVISSNVTVDISEYNDEADKLNSLLEKNNKINEKVSYSKKEVQDLIYMHNDYEIISEQEIKLINNEIEEILKNITLYNQMNCTSNYERFLSLNHFNGELTSCLIGNETNLTTSNSCENCKEPDFLFIIISCIIIIVLFFLYKKLKL